MHAGRKPFIRILKEFLLGECLRVLTLSEEDEEERELRDLEKLLLSYATVLVHRLADDGEVHRRVSQETIIFLVSMAKHEHLQQLDVVILGWLTRQSLQESRLCLCGILDNVVGDGLLLAF